MRASAAIMRMLSLDYAAIILDSTFLSRPIIRPSFSKLRLFSADISEIKADIAADIDLSIKISIYRFFFDFSFSIVKTAI